MKKRCFFCKQKYNLIFFNVNNCTYQVKGDLGRTVSCRLCSIRRAFKLGGYLHKIDGSFKFVEGNKTEIIKKFLIGK
jgi:hypothetical protein